MKFSSQPIIDKNVLEPVWNNTNKAIFTIGNDGRILTANPSYTAILGWDEEDFNDDNCFPFFSNISPTEHKQQLELFKQGQDIPYNVTKGSTEDVGNEEDGTTEAVGAPEENSASEEGSTSNEDNLTENGGKSEENTKDTAYAELAEKFASNLLALQAVLEKVENPKAKEALAKNKKLLKKLKRKAKKLPLK